LKIQKDTAKAARGIIPRAAFKIVLFKRFGIVGSFEKIIHGYVKVVRKLYERCVIGFEYARFVTAYGVLIYIQVHSQLNLRYIPLFSQKL